MGAVIFSHKEEQMGPRAAVFQNVL